MNLSGVLKATNWHKIQSLILRIVDIKQELPFIFKQLHFQLSISSFVKITFLLALITFIKQIQILVWRLKSHKLT